MNYLKKLISTSILLKLLLTLSPLTLTSNAQEKIDLGDPYYVSQHDDWSIKCIKAPENSPDPCQLYQQLYDENSDPVAEIHIFNLDQKSVAFMVRLQPTEATFTDHDLELVSQKIIDNVEDVTGAILRS